MTTGQALLELGLSAGATEEEVRKVYRTLVTKWHPDKHQNDPIRLRESELRIKRINKAFEVLQTIQFKTGNRTAQKTGGTKSSNTKERSKNNKRHKKSGSAKSPKSNNEIDKKESTITFMCSNNHRVTVPVKFAGKGGRCSKCNVRIVVPFPPQQVGLSIGEFGFIGGDILGK